MSETSNVNPIIELPSGKLYVRDKLDEPRTVTEFREACNAFVSRDEDTKLVKGRAVILAERDEPVLIYGESGTGKELLAKIIHGTRPGQFVAVNVCAVAETLFESEIFGHVKGSFTGAHKDRVGLIEEAEGGTLFLDEIGDMPLPLQAKMLRVLQNKSYRKVGTNEDQHVRCRIVAATHRDLRAMINDGKFRLDLFERLQVFRLCIKPLRERLRDLELYVGSKFIGECPMLWANNRENIKLSGNVRQLLNLKLRCDVFGMSVLTQEDLL